MFSVNILGKTKAIGDVLQFKKRTDEALAHYEEALGLYRAVGTRLGEANTLRAFGNHQSDLEQKLQLFQSSQQTYVAIGYRYSQSRNLCFIARTYESLNNTESAIQSWTTSRDLAISINYESFQTSAQKWIDRLCLE